MPALSALAGTSCGRLFFPETVRVRGMKVYDSIRAVIDMGGPGAIDRSDTPAAITGGGRGWLFYYALISTA